MFKSLFFALLYLFSQNSFCQINNCGFITEEKAILKAKKHGLYPKLIMRERAGSEYLNAKLDTVNGVWIIEFNKQTYKDWGKTTKNKKTDRRHRCKSTNGCYVVRTRIIWVDAIKGKVINKKRIKKVSGSYE